MHPIIKTHLKCEQIYFTEVSIIGKGICALLYMSPLYRIFDLSESSTDVCLISFQYERINGTFEDAIQYLLQTANMLDLVSLSISFYMFSF